LEALRELFSDLIISHGLWPPHSPDLWLLFVGKFRR
jgi:hypothetical protein